jgi:anti-sigma factor RsiW
MNEVLDITCRELVELVTEYLEDALSGEDRSRFEEHLAICDGCRVYVEQIRVVVEASGRLSEESLDSQARDALMVAFRDWNRGRSGPG